MSGASHDPMDYDEQPEWYLALFEASPRGFLRIAELLPFPFPLPFPLAVWASDEEIRIGDNIISLTVTASIAVISFGYSLT